MSSPELGLFSYEILGLVGRASPVSAISRRGRSRAGRAVHTGDPALRVELEELRAGVVESELVHAGLPHRSRYLGLVTAFPGRLLDVHDDLIDGVESTLGSRRDRGDDRRQGARREGARGGR